MPLTIAMTISRSLHTKAAGKQAFGLLADIPLTASLFPRIATISDLGCNTWRFETERIGIGNVTVLQLHVVSRYRFDQQKGIISWVPADSSESFRLEGRWKISEERKGSRIVLNASGSRDLNLPAFMKNLLTSLIRMEAEFLVSSFLDNLKTKLEGES